MNTKHTAGPWKAYESSDDGWFNIEAESDGSDVVGCEGCANEANARLIAAAPCLLEALQQATRRLDLDDDSEETEWLADDWQGAVDSVRCMMLEAIAKATGKEPA